MSTTIKLSESQIRKMQHSLGMDNKKPKRGKYEAYRNYYNTSIEDQELENLITLGLANKRVGIGAYPGIWYHITEAGIAYLGKIMNLKITELD